MKANGTDAKDIALHFMAKTGIHATRPFMARTISNVKTLLEAGISKREIIEIINFTVDVKKIPLYSFGFITTQYNKLLHEKAAHDVRDLIASAQTKPESEVQTNGESTKRNHSKLERFGIKPRVGTQFNFDMYEKPGSDG